MDTERDAGEPPPQQSTSVRPRPLTKCYPNGEPYERRSETIRQLLSALLLSPRAQVERAKISDKHDPRYLKDEVLVYLIRACYQREDERTGDWLLRLLIERCTGILTRELTRRLPKAEAIEAGQEMLVVLYEAVRDLGPQGDYLEVSFGQWFKCHTLDMRQKYETKLAKEPDTDAAPLEQLAGHQPAGGESGPAFDPVEPWNELSPSPADLLDREDREALQDDEERRLREAVAALPGTERAPWRKAVILHFWFGMKIDSVDPDEPTLARLFGKSEKTIRNWLNKAKAELKRRLEDSR